MKVISYDPKSQLLKKHIEVFNIISRTSEEDPTDVITFPHVNMALNIVEHNQLIKTGNNSYRARFNKKRKFNSVLSYGSNEPVHINYSGAFKEITIVFKPLGIHAFLEQNIAYYISKENLDAFIPFPDFKAQMTQIFKLKNQEEQLHVLEKYLETKLRGFNHPLLMKALDEMNSKDFSVKKFTRENKISVKSFIYQFKKHLGRTPVQHYKILRFRNSIQIDKLQTSLTKVALDSGYFDQSHFIKDFKKLTGKKPTEFFKNIDLSKNNKFISLMS